MTIGSLFSGIGGLELGLEWAGLGPVVWQVEKDPFCRRVLEKHWPGVRRYEDVRGVGANLERVDLICGGFPCQDISSAGKGAGLAGERSGLWREFARVVAGQLPSWVVVENVASGARRWVDEVVHGLGQLGYEALPVPVAADENGAGHRRARVFIVARTVEGSDAKRLQLRQQPRGRGREGWEGKALAPAAGADAGWPTEFEVAAPLHGVSRDVVRSLGNAVVPQCAEVVGWVIRELEGL